MAIRVATTSSGQLAYIPETEVGKTPDTGKGTKLRMTGESFEQTISKEVSKEMNDTRQTVGMFLTDAQVSGGWQFELSAREYDPILEALLMGTWSEYGSQGKSTPESVTFDKAGKTVTFTSAITGLDQLKDGSYLKLTGSDIKAENAKPLRVKSVAGNAVTVYNDLEDQTVADAVSHHGRLTNGVTERSFTFEKAISSINELFQYRGCRINKGSLNFESKAAITGSFDVIGMTSSNSKTRQLGDKQEYTASQTGSIIDAVLGMDGVFLDGEDLRKSLTAGIQKINLEYDNQMKGHDAVGVLGNVDVTAGTISCTLNITMYFKDGKIYDDVIKQKRFNLSWFVYDREGHGYAFTLPSVEIKSIKANMSDNDSAVMAELECQALMDSTTGKTIFIDRF